MSELACDALIDLSSRESLELGDGNLAFGAILYGELSRRARALRRAANASRIMVSLDQWALSRVAIEYRQLARDVECQLVRIARKGLSLKMRGATP